MPKELKVYPLIKKELTDEEKIELEHEYNKHTEYYSHLVNGWITTRMEKDKALLTLSTAGLGVLVTFFNNISTNHISSLSLYGLTLFCFIVSIISGVWVLSANADYCEAIIGDEEPKNDKLIDWLDKSLMGGFILGLIISIILVFVLIKDKEDDKKTTKIELSKSLNDLKKERSSLQKNYENEIMILKQETDNIKKLEEKITKIEITKKNLINDINNLSTSLKKLEDIDSLKKDKEILENKINNINKVN